MPYYNTLSAFYTGDEWRGFCDVLALERTNENGELICAHCGKPIVKKYDRIGHHSKIHLTLENVNDASISLNPENVEFVHFRCHNEIHLRFVAWTRHIYLVYGCPLAGKTTFIKENAGIHDLVIDIDRIYECITNNPPYVYSNRLYDNMKAVQTALLECIKYKRGKWINAFIVGGYPYKGERERICAEYGAEEVFIDCDKETAFSRLETARDGRDVKEWEKYISTWFNRYQA
jgi:hypothetical protein